MSYHDAMQSFGA